MPKTEEMIRKLFGFQRGGVVKMNKSKIRPGEVPFIARTGRVVIGPDFQYLSRPKTGRFTGKGHIIESTPLLSMDYSKIEKRIMAQMAEAMGVSMPEMRSLTDTVCLWTLREIDKGVSFAIGYGLDEPLQERIDEEGCGAVFCAARLTDV